MDGFKNENGVIKTLPLLSIIAAVGILSFLLVFSTAPLKGGLFGLLNPKPNSHAATNVNANLGMPSNLALTSLDSTLRANWTPSTDSNISWQLASVWDGSTLIGSKIVGKTQGVADMNGLQSGHSYTVKVQSMDVTGALSNIVAATASTDPQLPMDNAAFFDNFNEEPTVNLPSKFSPADLDPNYFDVRTYEPYGDMAQNTAARQVIRNERHYHTLIMGSNGEEGLIIRPRVPFDISGGRSGTFEFETDLAPGQHSHGKWFEIVLVDQNEIPGNHEQITAGGDPSNLPDHVNNSIEFSVFRSDNDSGGFSTQHQAVITARINGNLIKFPSNSFDLFTPTNIRVPVVIKVSQTAAQMYINGKLVVDTTNKTTLYNVTTLPTFNLPFSIGYWEILHTNYRSGLYDFTGIEKMATTTEQLIHWDNIQFDGLNSAYNPIVRTYIQPGCSGVVNIGSPSDGNFLQDCPPFTANSNNPIITLNIADDVTKARSARLMFNGGNLGSAISVAVSINGNPNITIPVKSINGTNDLTTIDLTPFLSQLKTGSNTFAFSTTVNNIYGLSQLELEVVYNLPRTIGNPPVMVMPMLNATKTDFRFDRLPAGAISDPGCTIVTNPTTMPNLYSDNQSGTTYLYNMGGVDPVSYTIKFLNPNKPWVTVTTSVGTIAGNSTGTLTGTISPIPNGGNLVPLTINIDFSKYTPGGSSDDSLGQPAIIEIDGVGVNMPIYIAVLGVKTTAASGYTEVPCVIPANNYLSYYMNTYNKCTTGNFLGVPGYDRPSCQNTITPVSTPTPTPTPTPSPHPSTSPNPCQGADLNHDGKVDLLDYSILVSHFNQTVTPGTLGDINNNGVVDLLDYSTLVFNFGKSGC